MAKRRITITELAIELNTTASTVSRALNGHNSISKVMKDRVIELAKKRNYTINRMASNLRTGKSKILGVVVARVNRDFFGNCIAGIEEVARAAGYSTIICQTRDILAEERKCIFTLIESNVDGILISTSAKTDDLDYFNEVQRLGVPIIFFDRDTKNPNQNKVIVDDKFGAYNGVCHLIDQGYKRIAHLAGPLHSKLYKERKKGYIKALKENSIKIDESLIIEGPMTKDFGYETMCSFMKIPNPPDALFSASDYSALGGLIYLKEIDVKVPDDFGIVGFSNEMFTSIVTPPLTTIDQHSKKI
ncbi:MAG: LacI family DNA-binding transcriptional regulator, partial [Saprospiraceae bacterium]